MKLHTRFTFTTALLSLALVAQAAPAQSAPVAFDDAYTTAQDRNLSVDAPGVLDNDDDADGDPLTAILVDSSQAVGTLFLNADGSFEYEPGGLVGEDTFTYKANDGSADSNTATITFTVTPGTTAQFYTDEALFLNALLAQGYTPRLESFEDDAVWGAARSPATAPSVTSQGITWESPIGASGVTTGPGPAFDGDWGFFALPHGDYLAGPQCLTPGVCTDRWRGSSVEPLVAIGGWVNAASTAKVRLFLDDDPSQPVGEEFVVSYRFLGVIAPAGFGAFEFREVEGVSTDAFYIFGDKFTFARAAPDPWTDLGGGTVGANGQPTLQGLGSLEPLSTLGLELTSAPPVVLALLWVATSSSPLAIFGGTLHAFPYLDQALLATDAAGAFAGSTLVPPAIPAGTDLWFQFLVEDPSVIYGITLSNAVRGTTP